jgi:hypothetical protein
VLQTRIDCGRQELHSTGGFFAWASGYFLYREIRLPFLTHYKKVYVYGVTETAPQNSVAQTLQKVNGERRGGKILLQFFDKENWTTWSDPATGRNGGRRGRETPLQSIWIN